MDPEKIVLSLSGGMDSATLLLHYLDMGYDCHILQFDYGQRHSCEIDALGNLLEYLCTFPGFKPLIFPQPVVDLRSVKKLLEGSALTSDNIDVPEGHYEEESMKLTVVPNRNALFLNLCSAFAVSRKIPFVAFGAHAGDHAIYPDCRIDFVRAVNLAVNLGNYQGVTIECPFINMDKLGILLHGREICKTHGICFEEFYGNTWTCYKGREKACGVCGSCRERLEAFKTLGRKDPVEYEVAS